MILFKTENLPREFEKLHAGLREKVEVLSAIAWARWRYDILVTSIARDDTSTHSNPPPYRFIDLSLIEGDGNELIREIMNKLYPRDDGKETVVPLNHGTAPHIHLQQPPD